MLGNPNDIVGVKSSTEVTQLTTDGKLRGNAALQNRNNERRCVSVECKKLVGE